MTNITSECISECIVQHEINSTLDWTITLLAEPTTDDMNHIYITEHNDETGTPFVQDIYLTRNQARDLFNLLNHVYEFGGNNV